MIERFLNWAFAKPPVAAQPAKTAVSGEVGWSESLLYANSSWPKYNPDTLMGLQGAKVYQRMMLDEQVKAVVRFRRDAITGRGFVFEYDKEDIEDVERADVDEGDTGDDLPDKSAQYTKRLTPRALHFKASNDLPLDGDNQRVDVAQLPESMGAEADSEEKSSELSDEQALRIRVFKQITCQIEGSFVDALNGIVTSMQNGFSVSEKVFKPIEVDGKTWTGIKRIALKPFSTFSFHPDEFGNIEKVTQRFEGNEQVIKDWQERFIHYVQNPDVDLHYGQSELREAYRAWFSKDMDIRFWNIFLERSASGFMWVSPKDGHELKAGTNEYNKLVTAMETVSAKTSLILPTGLELHVESPKTTDAFERAVAAHDKAIAKALLVPNLLGITEQGDTGSYSQSQTQLEAFLWTLQAETRRLEEALNEQLFKQLGDLNFGSGPYPRFKFKPLSEALKLQIIRMWKELVQVKAVQVTDTDEKYIRELLDFPEAGEPSAQPTPNPLIPPGAEIDPSQGALQKKEQVPDKAKEKRKLFTERAIKRVDFAVIDNKGTQLIGTASVKIQEAIKDGVTELIQFVKEQDLLNNPDKVTEVELPRRTVTRIRKAAETALKEAWDLGAQHARRELEKARGVRFAVDEMRLRDEAARKFLESRSALIGQDLADNARKKLTNVLFNGIKNGWTLDEMVSRIEDEVGATVLPQANTAVRTTVFEAINEARYELFTSPEMGGFVEALEFSAIIDGKTTEICQHMDGKIYPSDDPLWETYTPPLHFNCRSLLVAVTVRDTWRRSTNPEVEPAEGFGGP